MTQQSDEVDLDEPAPARNKANVKEIKDISYERMMYFCGNRGYILLSFSLQFVDRVIINGATTHMRSKPALVKKSRHPP